MATLASKGTVTVTLTPGQTLNVQKGGQGVAVLKGGQQKNQLFEIGSAVRKIGPFGFSMPIILNSQNGAITYYVAADSAAPHVDISAEYDETGLAVLSEVGLGAVGTAVRKATAIGIVGDSIMYTGIRPGAQIAGGTTIPGVAPFSASLACPATTVGSLQYRASDRSIRFTAAGDTAGEWVALSKSKRMWVSSGTAAQMIEVVIQADALGASDVTSAITGNAPSVGTYWNNVPAWISIFSDQRIQFVNAAAPGALLRHMSDCLDDLYERAQDEGVSLNEVWIQAGTNDCATGLTPSATTMLALTSAAITKAQGLFGAKVRVFPIPMRTLVNGGAPQAAWRDYNKGLPALCESLGAEFTDIWQRMIDPASNTATAAYTTMLSSGSPDGVHPSGVTSFFAAKGLYDTSYAGAVSGQSPLLVNAVDLYAAGTNDTGNLLPGFPIGSAGTAGAGGTATDVATGWIVVRDSGAITITGTKQADDRAGYNWQRLSLAASAAVGDSARYEYNLGVGVTTVDVGDEVEALVEINVPANAGLRRLSLWLTMVGASRNDTALFDTLEASDTNFAALPAVAWRGVIRTPAFKISADPTSMRIRFFFQTAVGATVDVDVRRVLLRKII